MTKFKLSSIQKQELLLAEQTTTQVQLLKRIQCIKMRDAGMQNNKIAVLLSKSDQTTSDWFILYKREGLKRLLQWNYKGKPSILTIENLEQLEKRNEEKPFEKASEAKSYIKKEFGVDFHLHWVQKILKKTSIYIQKNKVKARKKPI